ncbi:hypothetical protein F1880_008998 [Penicillium rolfsii]|nr:hypothetical protein F1880_008998 [Penicillium rolfsii]
MAQSLPPPAPCFYEHSAQSIVPILAQQMPYTSSLLRRIQHSLAYPSPTAKILATFPPGSTPGSSLAPSTPWLAAQVDLFRGRETQIILFSSLEAECDPPLIDAVTVDLSRYSGLAASPSAAEPALPNADANAKSHSHASSATTHALASNDQEGRPSPSYAVSTITAAPARLEIARSQLLAFLAYVKANLLPEYLSSLSDTSSRSGPSAAAAASAGVTLIPAPDPHAFLLGSFHTGLFEFLLQSGKFPLLDGDLGTPVKADPLPGLRVHRFDNPPYYKYFFPRDVFSPDVAGQTNTEAENPLPDGYRYHDRRGRTGVLPYQLDLVQSRTHIPRPRKQLESIPSVAIYQDHGSASNEDQDESENEMPIAWAFLGVDGAVATLHVEPEHRGRGLALSLSKEVMRRGMEADGVFGAKKIGLGDGEMRGLVEDWVHAEVAGYNKASRRVMEKIGGKVLTTVVWTVIEVTD